MSRVSLHLVAILVIMIMLGGLPGHQLPISSISICAGECLPEVTEPHTLDQNLTINFSAYLKSTEVPPYYSNEVHTIFVEVNGSSEELPSNDSSEVMLGLDGLESPECISVRVYAHRLGSGGNIIGYMWTYTGALNVTLRSDSRFLLGVATVGNSTLNLSYWLDVLPPRVLLTAKIDLPLEDQLWPEHEWVAAPVLIENLGGAPGTNLVVDFRYNGRIATTEYVNVIPPHGNVSLVVALYITMSGWDLGVHLVQGPDAPQVIAEIDIYPVRRPILDVVAISADPTSIESGSQVYLEAVVTNRGNATSDGQLVELMVDGTVVANASIEGLEPGNETVVSTNWTLTGVGVHTVSAHAEGDEFAAQPVAVNVEEKSPMPWLGLTILALFSSLIITRAARRSR